MIDGGLCVTGIIIILFICFYTHRIGLATDALATPSWRGKYRYLVPGTSCRQEEPRPHENTRICPKIFDLHHAGAFVKFVVVTTPTRRNES